MGLQFKIVYKQGKDNKAADAPSRVAHLLPTQIISEANPVWLQEIINSYATDPAAQTLLAELAVKGPNAQGFTLQQGLIRKDGKVWVGHNSAIQTKIIAALHDSAFIQGCKQLI